MAVPERRGAFHPVVLRALENSRDFHASNLELVKNKPDFAPLAASLKKAHADLDKSIKTGRLNKEAKKVIAQEIKSVQESKSRVEALVKYHTQQPGEVSKKEYRQRLEGSIQARIAALKEALRQSSKKASKK
ncbi:MAG: hypothetical protein NTY90_02165 [Candidatus Micrarchaeota archaeon]|nr:hypothetical protein [Candidatus Micrarchaeota archaeon]